MINSVSFNLEEQSLRLCEQRSVVLAGNLANSATPNYKARDLDFQDALKKSTSSLNGLAATHQGHISENNAGTHAKLLFRTPMQTSTDGNTVDEEIERKNFMSNAIRYQASLTFAQSKSMQLIKAIRGD